MSSRPHANVRVVDPRTYEVPPCRAPTDDDSNNSLSSPPRHCHNHDQYHYHRFKPCIADIPLFSGGDLESWLRQAEHYLRHHPTDDEERLYMIATYMEGLVAKWFSFKED